MAGEIQITVVGNATADPELHYSQSGKPVCNFTVASTPRTFDRQANEWKDGEVTFLRVSVWGDYAENVAVSVTKGMRLVVVGRYKQRQYEDKEGNKRTSTEIEADEIAPSLRYAQAVVQRIQRDAATRQAPSAYQQTQDGAWATPQEYAAATAPSAQAQPQMDVWATPGQANAAGYLDETPF